MIELRDTSERTEKYKRKSLWLRVKRDDAGLCMTTLCGADDSESKIEAIRGSPQGNRRHMRDTRSMWRRVGTRDETEETHKREE